MSCGDFLRTSLAALPIIPAVVFCNLYKRDSKSQNGGNEKLPVVMIEIGVQERR